MKAKAFVDLELAETVTIEELQDTLEDYAAGGWGISSRVVKSLVDRVNPSIEELDGLIKSASKGFNIQSERRETEAAGEYQDLLHYLQDKSSAKSPAESSEMVRPDLPLYPTPDGDMV